MRHQTNILKIILKLHFYNSEKLEQLEKKIIRKSVLALS